MSQHDLNLANAEGAPFRTDLNNALLALGSLMKGPSAPSAPIAGMLWIDDDTPSATIWTLSLYDGTDWIELGLIDITNNQFFFTFNNHTTETAPAVADVLAIFDASAGAYRKMTLENLFKVINLFTEDTAPDPYADFVPSFDASATGIKKVKMRLYAEKLAAVTALADGATITPNFGAAFNFEVTLGGNRTLAAPTGVIKGTSGVIAFVQDGSGNRTLAFNSAWKFPGSSDPVLSTAAGAKDLMGWYAYSTTEIWANMLKAFG